MSSKTIEEIELRIQEAKAALTNGYAAVNIAHDHAHASYDSATIASLEIARANLACREADVAFLRAALAIKASEGTK